MKKLKKWSWIWYSTKWVGNMEENEGKKGKEENNYSHYILIEKLPIIDLKKDITWQYTPSLLLHNMFKLRSCLVR